MIITPWLRVGENRNVQIFLSFGATEAKPPEDVDAIFDMMGLDSICRIVGAAV